MSQRKIIERYHLENRVLTLSAQGKKDYEIAEILSKEDLAGQDSLSQPTVSRWLKKVRKDRGVTAKGIVDDYLKESIPVDLKLLDELTQFHLVIFRGNITILEKDGEKIRVADINLDTRRIAARDIHEILKTKMKFIGVDGDNSGSEHSADPVDLEQYKSGPGELDSGLRRNDGENSDKEAAHG